jgi:hypothetical protein
VDDHLNQKRVVQAGEPPVIKVHNAGPALTTEIGRELAIFCSKYGRYPCSPFEQNLVVKQARLNLEWRKVKK